MGGWSVYCSALKENVVVIDGEDEVTRKRVRRLEVLPGLARVRSDFGKMRTCK